MRRKKRGLANRPHMQFNSIQFRLLADMQNKHPSWHSHNWGLQRLRKWS